MSPSTVIGIFMIGFGVGYAVSTKCWMALVDSAHAQIKRVLEQNSELLQTWEPDVDKIRRFEEVKELRRITDK